MPVNKNSCKYNSDSITSKTTFKTESGFTRQITAPENVLARQSLEIKIHCQAESQTENMDN